MRGEHISRVLENMVIPDSSPHARGTHIESEIRFLEDRFIPACAGNTSLRRFRVRSSSVHPRMRGEHSRYRASYICHYGSSLHARGTRASGYFYEDGMRFIPACAGNTAYDSAAIMASAVHPRMRGEHLRTSCPQYGDAGSSPHARGTLFRLTWRMFYLRFIPACAGNTSSLVSSESPWAVHPRMRGEHYATHCACSGGGGSSPHARGTPPVLNKGDVFTRFIPACAGNTITWQVPSFWKAVHPRMRGEHQRAVTDTNTAPGSSPHARGTRTSPGHADLLWRFIPACAGNTTATDQPRRIDTVHPRMRGEHSAALADIPVDTGSSPHARGTLVPVGRKGVDIPVHPRMRGEHSRQRRSGQVQTGSSPHARGTLKRFCAGVECITVHPRMRGEHQAVGGLSSRAGGSSPHARGTR